MSSSHPQRSAARLIEETTRTLAGMGAEGAAQRLRRVSENVQKYTPETLLGILDAQEVAETYQRQKLARWGQWFGLLRGAVALAILLFSLFALLRTASAYQAYVSSHPQNANQPFFLLWEQGFVSNDFLVSFSAFASIEAFLASLFIPLSVSDAIVKGRISRRAAFVQERFDEATLVLSDATRILADPKEWSYQVQSVMQGAVQLNHDAVQLSYKIDQQIERLQDVIYRLAEGLPRSLQDLTAQTQEMSVAIERLVQGVTLTSRAQSAQTTAQIVDTLRQLTQTLEQTNVASAAQVAQTVQALNALAQRLDVMERRDRPTRKGIGFFRPGERRSVSPPARVASPPEKEKGIKPPAIDVPGDRQQIPTPLATENVVFSAYHPLAIIQGARKPLLVSIALDDEKILAKMAAQAQEELARYDKGPFSGAVAPEIVALQRGSLIVIKPDIAGFRFNPPFLPVYWEKDYQSHLFEMWAETAQPGAHNGSIWIMINGLIKARIPLPISVLGSDARSRILNDHALSRGISLKKVFPSYSRKDQEIVDIFRTVEELGRDHYLQDLAYLRAGDDWETRIQGFIKDADLFQLFWSENAARSAEVENEWRFALAEHPGGFGFITPIYWSPIVYQPIPQELRPLDFQHFELGIFTRGKE